MIEEVEEISRLPALVEEVPFVGEAFRVGLIAPDDANEDGDPDVEFIYDAEVDVEEMSIGEQQALACIRTSKVLASPFHFVKRE